MNTEKKLEYFTQAITREVESKKRQARQQLTNDFNAAVYDAVTQAEAEAQAIITAEAQAIERANNKRITEAATESRRNLSALQENLTTQLFDEIAADITAFIKSSEYENYLINSIQSALAKSRHPYKYVQLPPDHAHLSNPIQNATSLITEQGEASMIGGFKLLTASRDKAVDQTFQSRLADIRQEFATQVAQSLVYSTECANAHSK